MNTSACVCVCTCVCARVCVHVCVCEREREGEGHVDSCNQRLLAAAVERQRGVLLTKRPRSWLKILQNVPQRTHISIFSGGGHAPDPPKMGR